MNEFCLIMFHTLLSSTVLETQQLVQIESKCGRMAEAKSTIPPKHVVILLVIHPDLLPSSIRTQSLHSTADCEHEDRQAARQAGRHTGR